MQRLVVQAADAGRRLDVVAAELADVSRSRVQQWLYEGSLALNGRSAKPSQVVVPGDRITITETEQEHTARPHRQSVGLAIVYEDRDLLVVDKPAGLPVHPTKPGDAQLTVADFARTRTSDPDTDRPGIVHRLDRDTSGLLILAKHPIAKAYMQHQFADRKVHKRYTALVVGRLDPAAAVLRLPIGRSHNDPTRREVNPMGRPSETSYLTQATYPGYSLVEARPTTGRTHQLRVHFAAVGHPLAGDTIYGLPKRPRGLSRQFLHATGLDFEAPSGQNVSLSVPLADDLAHFLASLDEGTK